MLIFKYSRDHRDLHSFPTRRSSDLLRILAQRNFPDVFPAVQVDGVQRPPRRSNGRIAFRIKKLFVSGEAILHGDQDRKSTRLNSSHVEISYAVFCLKKKTIKKYPIH